MCKEGEGDSEEREGAVGVGGDVGVRRVLKRKAAFRRTVISGSAERHVKVGSEKCSDGRRESTLQSVPQLSPPIVLLVLS